MTVTRSSFLVTAAKRRTHLTAWVDPGGSCALWGSACRIGDGAGRRCRTKADVNAGRGWCQLFFLGGLALIFFDSNIRYAPCR